MWVEARRRLTVAGWRRSTLSREPRYSRGSVGVAAWTVKFSLSAVERKLRAIRDKLAAVALVQDGAPE